MYWVLWTQAIVTILVISVVVYMYWRGAKKVRKDIFELARVKDEEEDETG